MIRKANINDLDRLVEIHMQNFDGNELSIILGRNFVRNFYKLILSDCNSNINVVVINDVISAFSTVFLKYSDFEKKIKIKSFTSILFFLIRHIFNLKKIQSVYKSAKTKKFSNYLDIDTYDFYVGAFVIDISYSEKPIVAIELSKAYARNIKLLEKYSSTYWGSCRVSNNKSLRMLKSKGMSSILEIESYPENIYLAIKEKKNEVSTTEHYR
ncbi:hypothetical protein [Vibrio sp. HN007]|uniref:hypothetical protein n=1 Tax=Vibrio iocasae TaxID=3098914 RepID=UPI0035D51905